MCQERKETTTTNVNFGTNTIFHTKRSFFWSCFSTDVEEVTIDPNSQWKPVPVKQEPKDEECQGPQPTKKARPSPPDSLPLSGVRTPTSQSSSGHYSPYQTQPPSNPGMGTPTPPGRTPPEMHSSSVGGQLPEQNSSSVGTTQASTTPSGELFKISRLTLSSPVQWLVTGLILLTKQTFHSHVA